jgi:hypothetical protein
VPAICVPDPRGACCLRHGASFTRQWAAALLSGLQRSRQTISRARAELADRKAKLPSGRDPEVYELEKAIAAAESAVDAACEEIRLRQEWPKRTRLQ